MTRVLAVLGGLILFSAGFDWAANSKEVVDFLFALNDPETELPFAPADGPMGFDQTVSRWEAAPLPADVEQPSGIEMRSNSMVLSTDKAEFLVFDLEGRLQSSLLLKSGPLLFRQGFAEGVTCADAITCYAIAGETQLFRLQADGRTWESQAFLSLAPHVPADVELQAIVANQTEPRLYLSAIHGETLSVWIIDVEAGSVQMQPIDVRTLALKPGRQLAELEVVGLGHEDRTLYVMTAPTNLLLALDTESWIVRNVIGLDGLGDSQGISVSNGLIYVVTDHEYHEPRQPLRWARLP